MIQRNEAEVDRLMLVSRKRDIVNCRAYLDSGTEDAAWLLEAIESYCLDMTWEASDATDLLMWVARQTLRSGEKVEIAHAFYARAAVAAILVLAQDGLDA